MTERKRKTLPPEQRRQEILDAAFAVFVERGYAATRIEEIAARAGIAKGTVYLHFSDKETLFTSLLSGVVSPLIDRLAVLSADETIQPRVAIAMLYRLMEDQVLTTQRLHLIRLILSEGPRFPVIAEFYYRNVVSPGLAGMRQLLGRAAARGQLRSPALAQVPQIVVSPLLLAIVWGSLFERLEPLDIRKLFDAFIDTLFVAKQGDLS